MLTLIEWGHSCIHFERLNLDYTPNDGTKSCWGLNAPTAGHWWQTWRQTKCVNVSVFKVCIWWSFEETNSLCFWLHHIWPLCTSRRCSARFGEGTAVAGDILHLSSELCQDSWTLSLLIASWIQENGVQSRRGDLLFLQPLPGAELRFPE